jgi:hypothetical protein
MTSSTQSLWQTAYRVAGFPLLILGLCLVTSLATTWWLAQAAARHDAGVEPHVWLGEELGLTADEIEGLAQFEAGYRAQKAQVQHEFELRMQSLADAIIRNHELTDDVLHAVHALHETHGELQVLSIEHYYIILAAIPESKRQRLRELAVHALSKPQ